jgi:hypothetical protein
MLNPVKKALTGKFVEHLIPRLHHRDISLERRISLLPFGTLFSTGENCSLFPLFWTTRGRDDAYVLGKKSHNFFF